MTDRFKALQELLDMVEDGGFPADTSARHLGLADVVEISGVPIIKRMYAAFSGSLDAAKALHEAVLPGWDWLLTSEASHAGEAPGPIACVAPHDSPDADISASDDFPARAWLIAIIKALIAEARK